MSAATQILLISGSIRGGSTNTAVLRTAQAVAPADGARHGASKSSGPARLLQVQTGGRQVLRKGIGQE